MMSTDAILVPDLARLPDDLTFLKELVAQLYGTVQDRERRIAQLEQHLHLLVKRFLHPASEKFDPRQLLLFAAAELAVESGAAAPEPPAAAEEPVQEKRPPKHTPHGRQRISDLFERKEVVHDLTPEQKAALGGEESLVYIGEDVTRKYEWTPASVLVVEHHHKKYVRREMDGNVGLEPDSVVNDGSAGGPGGGDSPADDRMVGGTPHEPVTAANAVAAVLPLPAAPVLTPELAARFAGPVIVAPRPPEAIPGGIAGPGLLAQVIVSKYGDHLPLYRLERIFARQGVHFARQTLCDWCAGCAKLLTPLAELIRDEVLASFVIHTDDTPVKLRDAQAKLKIQSRFWTYVGDERHRLIWFEFTNTRKRAGPDRVLAHYRGYLQADGYGGYDDYEGIELSEQSPILKVACWAHARRKFHDALRTEPLSAQIAMARIGQLYKLEKQLRQRSGEEWLDLPLEARAAMIAAERREHAQPILEDFHKWLEERAANALPKSPIAVAVRYTLNQWDALGRYVEDGRLSIDNNAAERSLRGIAIGRKNWLFCASENGGRTAATLFTMISSAVRNNLDPWAYLRDVLKRLPLLGEHPTREGMLPLLADRWQPPPADPA